MLLFTTVRREAICGQHGAFTPTTGQVDRSMPLFDGAKIMADCVGTVRARMRTRDGKTEIRSIFHVRYYITNFCKYFFFILSFGQGQIIFSRDSKVSMLM